MSTIDAMSINVCMNFSDIAILNIKSADFHCIFSEISESEAVRLLQNIDLTEKKWNIKN